MNANQSSQKVQVGRENLQMLLVAQACTLFRVDRHLQKNFCISGLMMLIRLSKIQLQSVMQVEEAGNDVHDDPSIFLLVPSRAKFRCTFGSASS